MRSEWLLLVGALGCNGGDTSSADAGVDVTYYTGGDGGVYAWNDAAGECQPLSTDGFTAKTITPVVNHVCTDAQVTGYVTQCLDPSLPDDTACLAWKAVAENAACVAACPVVTDVSATSWGSFVRVGSPGTLTFNDLGACVALMDPSQVGQACAAAIDAQLQCENAACVTQCAIETPDSGADAAAIYNDELALVYCTYAADSAECASQVKAVTDCAPNVAASARFCVDGTLSSGDPATANPAHEQLIGAQCGGAPADAGTD
ncbi:MAG TPA: hypothetical protein VGH87_20815 [Polyangiaceae bacterium]|jgi:hypothetical protein